MTSPPIWEIYLVVGFGVATLVTLLIRELAPGDHPASYWRVLDSASVALGAAFLISFLIEIGVLTTSI